MTDVRVSCSFHSFVLVLKRKNIFFLRRVYYDFRKFHHVRLHVSPSGGREHTVELRVQMFSISCLVTICSSTLIQCQSDFSMSAGRERSLSLTQLRANQGEDSRRSSVPGSLQSISGGVMVYLTVTS